MHTPTGSREKKNRAMEKRVKRQVVLLSILLHIFILAFWDSTLRLGLARLVPAPAVAKNNPPMVFDLQQPERPREVIATPADARTTDRQQKADFLSTQNALARNQEPAPHLAVTDDPFSRGDMASHELAQPAAPEAETRPSPSELPEAKGETSRDREMAGADTRPEAERAPAPAARKPLQLDLPRVPHRQLDGRAAEDGGLSFNTYEWDFAPYMLALKQRIGRNIFPPLAFSKLAMIDGDTLLRFKIYPDGRLADLELLGYKGHHSLMETSRFAVTASAPFPGLPADFPKNYLEVTARFSYFIKR
jgi:hypothetical protein